MVCRKNRNKPSYHGLKHHIYIFSTKKQVYYGMITNFDDNNTNDDGKADLFTVLGRANLTGGMVVQKSIVLKATLPDFCWSSKKKAVYLDGVQVHRKAHVERRDEEINDLMEQRGWQILRIPYEPPLTPEDATQIAKQIQEFISE